MKYFFVLHQHVFVDTKLLFVQRQTLFQQKIVFRATPNFCFGHRLEYYVMYISIVT